MKQLAVLAFALTGFLLSANVPAAVPPFVMSAEPNDVWKNVPKTTPADFWSTGSDLSNPTTDPGQGVTTDKPPKKKKPGRQK